MERRSHIPRIQWRSRKCFNNSWIQTESRLELTERWVRIITFHCFWGSWKGHKRKISCFNFTNIPSSRSVYLSCSLEPPRHFGMMCLELVKFDGMHVFIVGIIIVLMLLFFLFVGSCLLLGKTLLNQIISLHPALLLEKNKD